MFKKDNKPSEKQKQLAVEDQNKVCHSEEKPQPALGDLMASRTPRIPKRRRKKYLHCQL
jgi:hypothetical protein